MGRPAAAAALRTGAARLRSPFSAPLEAHLPEYVALQEERVDPRVGELPENPEYEALGRIVRGAPAEVIVRRRVDAVVPERDQGAKGALELLVDLERVADAVPAQRLDNGLDALKAVRKRDEDGQGQAGGARQADHVDRQSQGHALSSSLSRRAMAYLHACSPTAT